MESSNLQKFQKPPFPMFSFFFESISFHMNLVLKLWICAPMDTRKLADFGLSFVFIYVVFLFRIPALERLVTKILEEGLSVAAYLPDNNKIVGLILLKKQVPEDGDHGSQEIVEEESEKIKCLGNPVKLEKLYKFFDDLTMNYGKSSIFEV